MTDLRSSFKDWLIKQNCKERTDKGRPSTVYEYCKRIDRLCDKLYDNHSAENWEDLAINIGKVLISCYECSNKEYYIDQYNAKDALLYFHDIKHNCLDSNLFRASVNLVYNGNESLISEANFSQIDEYLEIFDFCLEQLKKNPTQNINDVLTLYTLRNEGSSVLVRDFFTAYSKVTSLSSLDSAIHIEYNNKDNIKTKQALKLFYEFLQKPSNLPIIAKLKDQRDDNEISSYIDKVEAVPDNLMKCLTQIHKTGKTALQIKSHYSNGYLPKSEVSSVLEIDHKTLDELNKKGLLTPNKSKGFYDEESVNNYLQLHFHKAKENYSEVDYSKKGFWCNRKEAAKIMNCSERTIYNYTKKGLLTYTDYSPQAPRYYKPELEHLAHCK